ncbi:MAG: PAS domain S-box protein, partial [Thermoleophilaceae bacterium]|nr:PAS domain S-box protein [Thermoleophilaceae bacterium]
TATRLTDLASAVQTNKGYDRTSFERIAPSLLTQPELNGVGFDLLVPAASRASYERDRNLQIVRPVTKGETKPAPQAANYFVRDSLAGRSDRASRLGSDVGAAPERRAAIEQAIASGKPSASRQTKLVGGDGASMSIYAPVYRTGAPLESAAQRRKAAVGVIAGIYSTPVLMSSVTALAPKHAAFSISDSTTLLGATGGNLNEPLSTNFIHLGQLWKLQVGRKVHGFVGTGLPIVLIGLFTVLMFAGLLLIVSRRERFAQAAVNARTEELQQASAELRDRLEFESSMLASIGDAVMACDADGNYVLANDAAFKLSGMLPGAVPFDRLPAAVQLIQPDGKTPMPIADTPMLRALRGEESDNFEMMIRHDNGVSRAVIGSARQIRTGDEVIGAIVTLHDVTDEKVTERQLAEAGRFFDLSQDLICTMTSAIQPLTLNRRWEEVLGWTREEILDIGLLPLVHPDDADKTDVAAVETAGGQQLLSFRNRYRAKDGSYHWFDWSAIGVPEDDRIYAAARDITKQVESERQLAEAARFYDVTRDMMITCKFGGQIIGANARWVDALGWGEADLMSKSFLDLVHPDERDEAERQAEHMATGGTMTDFRQRFLAKDGSYRCLEWSGVGVPEEGLFYGTARDITDRVGLELDLEHERAMLARAQEIAMLGHFEWDLSTGNRIWSDQQWKLYGLTPREGGPVYEEWMATIHEDDRQQILDLLEDRNQDPH